MAPHASSPYVLTTAQMRAVDRDVVARSGLPSLILMENAGRGVAEAILRRAPTAPGRPLVVSIVCGGGNNGGDGFVVARHLALARSDAGIGARTRVRVLLAAPREKSVGEAATMLRALEGVPNVAVSEFATEPDAGVWGTALSDADVIVDALFGIGLRDDVVGVPAVAIAAINAAPGTKVALDIPSGLDGDTGRPHRVSVRADVTITIGALKVGLVIDPDAGVGQLDVVGFGCPIDPAHSLGPFCFWNDEPSVRGSLPARTGGAHKGTAGHLIVVAGSRGKTGAALLTARAAMRAGAGLVTVASTAAGQRALDAKVVEAMTVSFTDADDATPDSFQIIAAACAGPSVRAVALGPGIPTGPGMRDLVLRLAREIPVPLVLDADGLNALGPAAAAILAEARAPRVVTPHPGEMGRLCGQPTERVQRDRLRIARDFAATSGSFVVLKGARTLVVAPDGTAFVNPTVEPALATAGSGDVLTGVLGGLLAQGMEPFSAARAAVLLHGCAGTRAAAAFGSPGVIAGDLPDAVAAVRAAGFAESSAGSGDNR